MKKIIFLSLIVLFALNFTMAQSADGVTKAIETEKATCGQCAYFIATALELVKDNASEREALESLMNAGIVSKNYEPSTIIRKDVFSGMCMKAWKLKGGLFYTITKANRYAFREFKAMGFFDSNSFPSQSISGPDMLDIISTIASADIGGE